MSSMMQHTDKWHQSYNKGEILRHFYVCNVQQA